MARACYARGWEGECSVCWRQAVQRVGAIQQQQAKVAAKEFADELRERKQAEEAAKELAAERQEPVRSEGRARRDRRLRRDSMRARRPEERDFTTIMHAPSACKAFGAELRRARRRCDGSFAGSCQRRVSAETAGSGGPASAGDSGSCASISKWTARTGEGGRRTGCAAAGAGDCVRGLEGSGRLASASSSGRLLVSGTTPGFTSREGDKEACVTSCTSARARNRFISAG